jgi:hypothetical protein
VTRQTQSARSGTRNLKGSGSVTRVSNGRFMAKVPVGRTNGRTQYATKRFKTMREAVSWKYEALALRDKGQLMAGPRQTFEKFACDVLLNSNDRVSSRTRDGYLRNLRKHVFGAMGSVPLSEVRPQMVEGLLSDLRKTYRAATVNNVRIAMSKVFTTAERYGLVFANPVARTEKARRGEFEKRRFARLFPLKRSRASSKLHGKPNWRQSLPSQSSLVCEGESCWD